MVRMLPSWESVSRRLYPESIAITHDASSDNDIYGKCAFGINGILGRWKMGIIMVRAPFYNALNGINCWLSNVA